MRFFTQRLLHPPRLLAALGLLLATASVAQAQTTNFAYTGGTQTYTVPTGVTKLQVVAKGGGSGASQYGNTVAGAQVQATVTVVPGEVLTVVVGGQGANQNSGGNAAGGYNGGGSTGNHGGGAGGATDLRRSGTSTGDYLTSRNALLVAAGAGGTGYSVNGGAAGTPAGGNGAGSGAALGGGGATTTAAGTSGSGGNAGLNGTGGDGGAGSFGGGGGGYYGGGSGYYSGTGGGLDASGGGGSSYVLPTGSSAITYSTASSVASGALAITPVITAPVAASQAVTVQLAANGTATLQATSVNNGSTGGGNTYTIQKIRYGQVSEGSPLTLTAPTGFTFTSSVPFASYGTPSGSNGNYTLGSCNAGNSASVVNGILSSQNTGTIGATNGTFGDPCNGTPKSLAVVAAYSASAASQPYGLAEVGSDNYVLLTATNASGSSTRTAQVTVVPYANNALAFDGTDDYVALPSPAALSNLGVSGGTWETWVYLNNTNIGSFIRKDGDYNFLVLSGAVPYIEVWNQGTGNAARVTMQGTTNLTANTWNHVAATWNGTTLRLYLNGVDVSGTQNSSPISTSGALQLGNSATYNNPLNGRLDEVRIYNTALTLAQVQADRFSTSSALPANLKYYANFDQGSAGGNNAGLTSLTDQSGNGNTGTLTNFALTGTSSNWVRSFPTITALSPTSGSVGTSVTVTGTNLTDATGFAFNSTGAVQTTPTNDLTATVAVPGGATTGPVSVFSATLARYSGPVFTVTGASASTNNALAFDGTDDYVALPSSTPVPVGNSNYTIEAWIKPTSMGVYGIVGWGNYGANNQVNALRLDPANGGSLRNYWWANDLSVTVGNLADGKWHHVAATFDGTTRAIYVDGVFKGSDTPSGHNVPNADNMRLGVTCANCPQVNGFAVEYFPGSLDEVRIYNVGLTQAQVQADMYSTTSALPASQKYYANFDQGTAGGTNASVTSLTDQSGNGSTGTLTNFALTGTSSNWVRSFPTITALSPTSGKSGTSVTLTGTNLTDATSFAFNGTSTTNFTTPASDLTATLTAPVGVTTGPVSVASATLTRYNGPVFTLVNDLVVTTTQSIPADSYSSITVNSPGVGTLAGNVTVSGSTTVGSGATLNDGCNTLTGAGSFTLAAGGTLGICAAQGISSSGATGAIQNTGTRSFASDASYVYNGTAAQSTGSGLPAQVRNLSTTNASPVTLSQPTSVAQALTVGGSGNLATGGNALTLLSRSAGTALIVNSGSGTVNGATTVQRYIDPSLNSGNGYRHYSAPVSNTTLADLATAGYAPEISQAATYNGSATPGTTTPFPTLFAYDQSRLATVTNNYSAFDKGFVVPTALSAPMSVGRGYVAQIGAAALVDFVGTPTTGDQSALTLTRNAAGTANAAAAGWQLVGNPYPSPLDWSLVAAADRPNLDGAMYVVQSSGPYAGSYRTYTNGQSTSATNNPLIASSQGFWVRVSQGQTTGSLTFRQAQRVTSYASQQAFQRTTADPRPALRLELAGQGLADGWVTYAEAGATAAFDPQYDAAKLPNGTGLNLSSASATDNLAIDGQAAFTATTVLPLAVGVPAAGTYTLTATALSNLPAGLTAYLHDGATGQTLALAVGSTYSFNVTAAQAQALLLGRFTLQFSASATPLAATPAALAAQVLVYPNPAHGSLTVALPGVPGTAVVQAELLNTLGQVVRRQQAALPAGGTTLTMPVDGLATGVYVLRLATGTTTILKRVVLN